MKKLVTLMLITLCSAQVMAMGTPPLKCFGTEPFWGMTTQGSTLNLANFGDETKAYTIKNIAPAVGTSASWTTLITAENGKEKMSLITRREACNDGMSDKVYTYSAYVQTGGVLLVGCCNDN